MFALLIILNFLPHTQSRLTMNSINECMMKMKENSSDWWLLDFKKIRRFNRCLVRSYFKINTHAHNFLILCFWEFFYLYIFLKDKAKKEEEEGWKSWCQTYALIALSHLLLLFVKINIRITRRSKKPGILRMRTTTHVGIWMRYVIATIIRYSYSPLWRFLFFISSKYMYTRYIRLYFMREISVLTEEVVKSLKFIWDCCLNALRNVLQVLIHK